jgi:NAD(P)H-dependent FMN reductase
MPVRKDGREPLRIQVFSASLRDDSLNTRLARLVAVEIERFGAEVDLASMHEFDAPSYDGDETLPLKRRR